MVRRNACSNFLVAQQLNMSSCFFFCFFLYVPSKLWIRLHESQPYQTKPNQMWPYKIDLSQPKQTKLKQTKKDHTNVTKIQASPLLSVCPILFTYKLTFPNKTHKLDQTKIAINGIGMAKSAAQLLYGSVLALEENAGKK